MVQPIATPINSLPLLIDLKAYLSKYITKIHCYSIRSAPHAKPLQSWSFSSFDGSSVPGSPSLSAHGEVTKDGDGIHFNGVTSSMDTYITGSQCLVFTDFCENGFSFGTKLKLDKIANGYTEPRFILDTGGHGEKTSGVSLFVENKKLVAEVTTKNKRYRVR